ncbi:hypothetical protein ASG17_13365 [Brevundimonas sp. Leaf363]|uniref:hypothetical protein n=1 Tax=Brevundimonas sp. Leaf363 TaxID=1736353 RepID=UPI0006F493C1|nr:hypothetical protein [Brevundimonas sp. Leaf363]KQS53938.1 hypothetical protein ASG17_13365 [Brevundimonas sp. Leaf363]
MSFAPAYLSAVAAQIGGLSAFLGGFAATFLGTLLAINARGRLATVAIGFSAASSVAFIVAVVGSTAVVAALHPEGPGLGVARVGGTQALMTLAFMLGLYALLAALGLSGWLRSRGTGLTTSVVVAIGCVLLTGMLVSVG